MLTLQGNWKELWTMTVAIIPFVISAFGIVTKGLLKGQEDLEVGGRVETIQTTSFWERPEYWEESWTLEVTCCHSNSNEWPTANADVKNSQGVNRDFNIQMDHLIPTRRPDLIIINKKKKRICKIVDLAVPVDHRIKLKECEKKDRYLNPARELKKLWNMKVTIVPIVIGAFATIIKGLLKGLEDLEVGGRVETIQMTALQRTAKILRRVLET